MILGLIGYGSIGRSLVELLDASDRWSFVALVRSHSEAPVSKKVRLVTSVEAFLRAAPDLVVECAGHEAVKTVLPCVLQAGCDAIIASVGALADARAQGALDDAAGRGAARYVLPGGAVGGLDLMKSLSPAGVDVTYVGVKPVQAWRGTKAEELADLDGLDDPVVFFRGTAREAALTFPKNANVVATLALAGAGLDRMSVELVADPRAQGNRHSYRVTSPLCRYSVEIEGAASSNAKTSATTVYSILRKVEEWRVSQLARLPRNRPAVK